MAKSTIRTFQLPGDGINIRSSKQKEEQLNQKQIVHMLETHEKLTSVERKVH